MATPRIVDATLPAVWRGATSPLDRDAVALLTDVLPLHAPGVAGSIPLVAPGAFGHDALAAAAIRAHVLEPLDHAALTGLTGVTALATVARGGEPAPLDAAPADPMIVVHPEPIGPMTEPPHPDPAAPGDGLVWERRFILPATTAPATASDAVAVVLDQLPPNVRLRVEDPHGVLDLAAAARLACHPEARRMSVLPSDARGIATAIAQTLLAERDGPAVVATLLGRAPRGAAAIEHLVAPSEPPRWRPAVDALTLTTSRPVPPEHPHWGHDGTDRRLVHPDRLDELVQQHLDQWQLQLTNREHDHLMHTLRARLRPGDRLDGPTLWATLATITDLTQRASRTDTPEAQP